MERVPVIKKSLYEMDLFNRIKGVSFDNSEYSPIKIILRDN